MPKTQTFTDRFRFSGIVILESLGFGERRTGWQLYNDVWKPRADADSTLVAQYYEVASRSELFVYLDAIREQLFAAEAIPILHIEAHGTKEGIKLKNRDVVPWADLRKPLTMMNQRCGFNLFVAMSLCHGSHLRTQLLPTDRAPVWAVVGPASDIMDDRLYLAFEAFYRHLLDHRDGRAAIDALNDAKQVADDRIVFDTAELMFCRVFGNYWRELCTPPQLQDRENELVAILTRMRGYDIRVAIDARHFAKQLLGNQRLFFDHFKDHFLMLDQFPWNRPRFQFTYEDCTQAV